MSASTNTTTTDAAPTTSATTSSASPTQTTTTSVNPPPSTTAQTGAPTTTDPPTTLFLTTQSPPTPPPDASESDFLVVSLIVMSVLLLVFGAIILACKRAVLRTSAKERRRRQLDDMTKGEALSRKVWLLVEANRDAELAAAASNRLGDGLLEKSAGGEEAHGGEEEGLDEESVDSDIAYADFSHCPPDGVRPSDLVADEDARAAEEALARLEADRRERKVSHIPMSGRVTSPLDYLVNTRTTFANEPGQMNADMAGSGGTMTAAEASRVLMLDDSAVAPGTSTRLPPVRPGALPWLAGDGTKGAAWSDGLDLTATAVTDDGRWSQAAVAERHGRSRVGHHTYSFIRKQ